QRLRAGGDHQEETSSERVPTYAATDLVADALRETAAETSGCGRRANRNQPRILQATESIRVLTGHYWIAHKKGNAHTRLLYGSVTSEGWHVQQETGLPGQ